LTDFDSLRGEAGGADEWNEIDEVLAEVETSASAKKGIKAALAWRWRAEVEQLAVAAQSELHDMAMLLKEDGTASAVIGEQNVHYDRWCARVA
jgi:hypothetical protein